MKSSVPLYQHLKSSLLKDIESRQLIAGDLIPSEPELAEKFGVSRTTVRQAIGDLVSMGYLVRQQGRGTFVSTRKPSAARSTLYGFAEELKLRGNQVAIKMISIDVSKGNEQIIHRLHTDQNVLLVRRAALIHTQCIFYESSYLVLPPHLDQLELVHNPEPLNSVYGFFETNGVKIGSGRQIVKAEKATDEDVDILSLNDGDPVLVVERLTHDLTGCPVEFSIVRYRPDQYEFQVNLQRES